MFVEITRVDGTIDLDVISGRKGDTGPAGPRGPSGPGADVTAAEIEAARDAAAEAAALAEQAAAAAAAGGTTTDEVMAARIADPESATARELSATVAPIVGPVAKRAAGARGQFYNVTGSSLRRFRAAQARAAAGGAPVTIVVPGDSIVQNTLAAPFNVNGWLARFQAMIERREGAFSQLITFMDLPGQDDRYTQTGTWGRLAGKGWVGGQMATTVDPSATRTLTGYGSRVSLRYLKTPDAGTFTYSLDGGAPVTVDAAGAEAVGEVVLTPALGTHTLVITKANDTTRMSLVDAEFRRGTTGGYRIIKAAMAGQKIANFTSGTYSGPGSPLELLKAAAPDLVIAALEMNDWGNGPTPVATYKAGHRTLIQAARLTGDVLEIATNPAAGPFISPVGTSIEPYDQALYELADEEDVALLHMRERWGTYTEALALGLMANEAAGTPQYHPSDRGNWDYAKAVFEALFQGWQGKSPVDPDAAQTWSARQRFGLASPAQAAMILGYYDGTAAWPFPTTGPFVLVGPSGDVYTAAHTGRTWQHRSDFTLQAGKKFKGETVNHPGADIDNFARLKVYANVAALPAAATATAGAVAFVTGSGLVYSDGAAWKRVADDSAL
ncbi:SGNH/GDSL hydrolase family protein [Nocardioides sp. ChNu-99]|uniref:SGNH/GDSL hydrolase family protein n=1 Tax=Nocardioides sp. ChNu-99 TaxID=2839897 RepID=UPI0024049B0F|nr:SGNH/GDSL hydrolase family protein [Nocardioides sp. ChNu-99]MDF9715852.1 SGNH/GDSL hydrolase family protein [Nocardioides sp. ChNu-99]